MLVPVGMKEKSIKAHCLPETCAHAEYLLDGGTKDLGKTNTFEGTDISNITSEKPAREKQARRNSSGVREHTYLYPIIESLKVSKRPGE